MAHFCLALCQWWRTKKRTQWVVAHSVKKRDISIDTMLIKKRDVLIERQVWTDLKLLNEP